MENATLIILQVAILGVFTLVGIIFTYALPDPSDPQKASAAYYARLFLFFLWVGFVFLCLRSLELTALHVAGCNASFTLAAYMVLVTVIKRHGQALGTGRLFIMSAHLLVLEALSLFAFSANSPFILIDGLLAMSVLIPLIWAVFAKQRLMDRRNSGDRLLHRLLLISIAGFIACMPIYIINIDAPDARQMLFTFGLIVVLMLNFMLGFVASVIRSLVIRLRQQIYQDPLTECHNRHYLQDFAPKFVEMMQATSSKVCVLVSDIDRFKNINDTYGHLIGDKALNYFSKQLKAGLRENDVLIRMGGEEFLIVLPECSLKNAAVLAERLRMNVAREPLRIEAKSFSLTASFGLAEIRPDYDFFAAINRADLALYDAKSAGRNRVAINDDFQRADNDMSMAFQ